MRIVHSLEEEVWREFVARHRQGNIFHTPEMFQLFGRLKEHRPTLWVTVDGGNQPLAVLLPVEITLRGGLLRPLTTRAVVYGSVLCAPGREGREALALLLRKYNSESKGNLLFTELRNLSDVSELQPVLNESGFTYEAHLNYLIDLNHPEEVLWQRISKTGQQRVRAARKKGVVIEEVTDPRRQLFGAYQLLREVYARANVPLADVALFEAAFEVLAPREMFKIFLARVGQSCIGARFLLMYRDTIIDWYAGADRAFSSYSPNELLVWHTIQWGKEHNFRLFDFGGAGRPDEEYGPREFKAKFGGVLVNYGRNTRVHSPFRLRFSRAGYRMMRRFLR